MNIKFSKKRTLTLITLGVFSVFSLSGIYYLTKPKKRLPIFNPTDINPQLVDFSKRHIKNNHTISDFSLINQNGDTISQKDYQGSIYVADFFFTRCKTICPIMANNMLEVQNYFIDNPRVKFLSHSVTPDIDSVAVLRSYANQKGAIDYKWNITTGDKKHIYNLARRSYFAVLDQGDGSDQDFIHTENFVLVDYENRIRGYYQGTLKKDIERLIADIEILEEEFKMYYQL